MQNQVEWKKIAIEDKAVIDPYYKMEQETCCDFTFANNWLWAPHYNITYAIIEEMLVFMLNESQPLFTFPRGQGDVGAVISLLREYCTQQLGTPFVMELVSPEQFEQIDAWFPGEYVYEEDRDASDYVYEAEKLMTLSGKKLHSKRNHISRFQENNPDWSYETIGSNNLEECLEMAKKWRIESGCAGDPEKCAELCVTLRALQNMEVLGLRGGLIRAGGRVIAFSLGEPCSKNMFVVHIEKAYAEIQGAYPIINQQFVLHEAADYEYINREDDNGSEGLRKAKLSYYPAFLVQKGLVRCKTDLK